MPQRWPARNLSVLHKNHKNCLQKSKKDFPLLSKEPGCWTCFNFLLYWGIARNRISQAPRSPRLSNPEGCLTWVVQRLPERFEKVSIRLGPKKEVPSRDDAFWFPTGSLYTVEKLGFAFVQTKRLDCGRCQQINLKILRPKRNITRKQRKPKRVVENEASDNFDPSSLQISGSCGAMNFHRSRASLGRVVPTRGPSNHFSSCFYPTGMKDLD